MIMLIHGEDIAASRKYFSNLKEQNLNPISLSGDHITLTALTEALESNTFFETEAKTVFIEQFITRKKTSKEFPILTDYLASKTATAEIFLWEGKEIDKKTLVTLKQVVPKLFAYPQTLFQFLDSIKPGNCKVLINLFHQTLATTEAEAIFALLTRHIRILLALTDTKSEPIEEVKRLASWQKDKLRKQAAAFHQETLIALHNKLFEIDYGQKTGSLPLPLISTIDILLLTI